MINITNNKSLTIQLAIICNDIENFQDYEVLKGHAFYKGSYIGDIKADIQDLCMNVYFKPVKPVEIITIDLIIRKND